MVRSPTESRDCPCCPALKRTLPRVYWLPGSVSPVAKRRGREDEQVPLSSALVKNERGLYFQSSVCLPGDLIKHKGSFIL